MNDYYLHLLIIIMIYGILAQSFNICFGLGRSFNLAHIACYALGAYASALWSTELFEVTVGFFDVSTSSLGFQYAGMTLLFIWCFFLSALVSSVLAFILGAISIRLDSDYFAIGTLAFSYVISSLLTNWRSLTKGVLGIPGIPRPEILGISLQDNEYFAITLGVTFVITQLLLYIMSHNSFSRKLRAQAEYEHAAFSLAVPAKTVRLASFLASAACAGIAGSFFAFYLNFIDPSSFSFAEMTLILTIVVVGQPGNFWGCLGATAFLLLLPEFISSIDWINQRPEILGPMRQLVFAVVLFTVVHINKSRLFPVTRHV